MALRLLPRYSSLDYSVAHYFNSVSGSFGPGSTLIRVTYHRCCPTLCVMHFLRNPYYSIPCSGNANHRLSLFCVASIANHCVSTVLVLYQVRLFPVCAFDTLVPNRPELWFALYTLGKVDRQARARHVIISY